MQVWFVISGTKICLSRHLLQECITCNFLIDALVVLRITFHKSVFKDEVIEVQRRMKNSFKISETLVCFFPKSLPQIPRPFCLSYLTFYT